MSRPRFAPVFFAVAALAGAVACRRAVRPQVENVLLVSIDSLRADRVGAYGNPRATTPTLDRLAAEGVRFENAASPTSWTLPSHVALLTGRSQHHHRTILVDDRIPGSERLLAEVLGGRGYETVGFYSGPLLDPAYGFDRGFAAYVGCESPETAALRGVESYDSSHRDRTNDRIADAFRAWVARRSTRPFFAFVHMWDVHYDYIPPEPYAAMFDPGYTGRLDGRNILGAGFPLNASARDVEHLLALYDGELRYTDDTIGRLLAMLDEKGLLERTLVVVVADHGDQFLEHGGKGHQSSLFEELVHVPMILWARAGLPRGRHVAAPVSLVDVAPTILDALGLPPLDGADGETLLPLVAGRARTRPVFGVLYNSITGDVEVADVREGDVKVIRDKAGQWAEYDLRRDPGEHAPTPPAAGSPLVAALGRQLDEARAAFDAYRAASPERNAEALPPELERKLRSLGYVH
jgi:arylsulfatase A-like enzyme